MDKLIREALNEKAEEVNVPAGAWQRIRSEIRPAPWWQRYRIGSRIELVAAVAALLLILVLGAALPALRQGPVDRELTPAGIPVVEHRIADARAIGDQTLKLVEQIPFGGGPARAGVEEANALLQPFGYRIEQESRSSFALYQGDQLLLGHLTRFGPVTVSSRQDDFIFLASQGPDHQWLVRASGPQEWDLAEYLRHRYQPPVYVGDDLIAVRWEAEDQAFAVWRGEERIFTIPLGEQQSGNAVKRLVSWSGHWVLEVAGTVYIDGRSLNQELGYDEIFEWRLVNGKPFYLFRQGKRFGISYDGQVLPYRYDEVPHYLCCEPALLNPRSNERMVTFFGRRGGDWYWVEVGSVSSDPEAASGQVDFVVFALSGPPLTQEQPELMSATAVDALRTN